MQLCNVARSKKLLTLVPALALGLSGTAAWAGLVCDSA